MKKEFVRVEDKWLIDRNNVIALNYDPTLKKVYVICEGREKVTAIIPAEDMETVDRIFKAING